MDPAQASFNILYLLSVADGAVTDAEVATLQNFVTTTYKSQLSHEFFQKDMTAINQMGTPQRQERFAQALEVIAAAAREGKDDWRSSTYNWIKSQAIADGDLSAGEIALIRQLGTAWNFNVDGDLALMKSSVDNWRGSRLFVNLIALVGAGFLSWAFVWAVNALLIQAPTSSWQLWLLYFVLTSNLPAFYESVTNLKTQQAGVWVPLLSLGFAYASTWLGCSLVLWRSPGDLWSLLYANPNIFSGQGMYALPLASEFWWVLGLSFAFIAIRFVMQLNEKK